jgi:hypothetical protein
MKKVKIIENEKIIAFDFNAAILKDNILFEICKELALTDIYVDIFGVHSSKYNFSKELVKKNGAFTLSSIDKFGSYAIKAKISDIPTIVEVLSVFDFNDLNIWDVYTDWDQYLIDKKIYKPISIISEAKVYLNYNPLEKHKVELYLDKSYNAKKIYQKIDKLVK